MNDVCRFPADEEQRKKWAAKIRRLDDDDRPWQPGPHAVVCSAHFTDDDFYTQWSRKLVKPGAVPTVFSFTAPARKRKPPTRRLTETPPSTASAVEDQPAPSSSSEQQPQTSAATSIAFHSYSLSSPTKLKKHNEMLRLRLKHKINLLRNARRREQRLKGTVSNLLERLKQQRLLSDHAHELLDAYKDIPLDLFRTDKYDSYSETQKQFACTLHYYSPAAYSYVRSKFKKMPHPRTIRRWLSAFSARPGLTQHSFTTITEQLKGPNANAYKLCTLHMDEMEIKRQVDFDRRSGQVYGFTDIGCGALDDDSQPQATKVLMVVAVGVTGYWKLPVAYYLTDSSNAQLQSSVLNDVIKQLWECGCVAISVTFDGCYANQKTLLTLGGSLNPDNITHPSLLEMSVVTVFDACHMIKLMRNLLNEYQIINVPSVGKAKWQHLQSLHELQTKEGLTLANKLTTQHLEYKTQKMKVRLAVQVISASCASALKYLRTNNYPGFEDTEATEVLLEKVDRLFDILNSRSKFGTGYKGAVTCSNANMKIKILTDTKQFLLSLEDSNGKKIIETRRRTCILGFCATIDSVIYLVRNLLLNENGVNGIRLSYLLTYKLSQDHIETMFGMIRRRFGWNNNPTALQFMHAYRAILRKIGVTASESGNVTSLDVTDDLTDPDLDADQSDVFTDDDECIVNTDVIRESLPKLSSYVDNVCVYIAGFVVRRLLPKLKCTECRELLVAVDCVSNSGFLCLKDNGGLIKPSAGVVRIVETAERNIRHLVSTDKPAHTVSRLGLRLEHAVLSSVDFSNVFGQTSHTVDSADGIESHVFSLTRHIVRMYLDLRKFHIFKTWNISQRGKNVRQALTKTILFRNQ